MLCHLQQYVALAPIRKKKLVFERFKGGRLKIVVGVDFNTQASTLVSYLKDLQNVTIGADGVRSEITLVHAVEPWRDYQWLTTFPGEVLYSSIAREVEDSARAEAQRKIEELKDSLQGIEVSARVVMGSAPEALDAFARSTNASMIVVSSSPEGDGQRFFPKGFSTSLSLMGIAKKPVMVIPRGYTQFKKAPRLKIMFGDDLSAHSQEALEIALEMSFGFSNVEFLHLHICKTPRPEMVTAAENLLKLVSLYDLPLEKPYSPQEIADETESNLKNKMQQRLGAADLLFTATGSKYQNHVLFGSLDEMLPQATATFDPDILVFGRHKMLHRKPFGIGRLPFSAMLAQKKPVVIVG
jgi:nucleotide-binding universal stress UspA family protein